MENSELLSAEQDLVKILGEAKPPSYRQLLGRKFLFISDQESHHEVLVGTIIGARLTRILELYVSTPEFMDSPLRTIGLDERGWFVRLSSTSETYAGKLELID